MTDEQRTLLELERQHGVYLPPGQAYATLVLAERYAAMFATRDHADIVEACELTTCRVRTSI
jgi:hypothetical protein